MDASLKHLSKPAGTSAKLSPLGAGFSPAAAALRPAWEDRQRHPQEPATIRSGFDLDEAAGPSGRRASDPVLHL